MTKEDVLKNCYGQTIIGETALFMNDRIDDCSIIDLSVFGPLGVGMYEYTHRGEPEYPLVPFTGFYRTFKKNGHEIRLNNIYDKIRTHTIESGGVWIEKSSSVIDRFMKKYCELKDSNNEYPEQLRIKEMNYYKSILKKVGIDL